jgi:hypothetical protein
MAQAVSRRPLTTEARIRARFNPCGICGGRSGTGTGFSPSSSVFPCQYNSTVALQTHIVRQMNMSVSGSSSETLDLMEQYFVSRVAQSVSDYGLEDQFIEVRSSAEARGFFPLASVSRPPLGFTQPPVKWVPGVLSPVLKRGLGVTLTTHPHLLPISRMSRSYTSSTNQAHSGSVVRQLSGAISMTMCD